MTPDEFRDLALSMQGAIERAHMGHPDFRANGRIFATLHADDEWGTVKLTPEQQKEFLKTNPSMFVPSSGGWGRQGYTNVRLDSVDEAALRAAMILAWENVTELPAPKARRAARRTGTRKR